MPLQNHARHTPGETSSSRQSHSPLTTDREPEKKMETVFSWRFRPSQNPCQNIVIVFIKYRPTVLGVYREGVHLSCLWWLHRQGDLSPSLAFPRCKNCLQLFRVVNTLTCSIRDVYKSYKHVVFSAGRRPTQNMGLFC